MTPGSYRQGGPLRLLTIALAASVLLLVSVGYDVWVGARVTPSLLRYVPPGSEGYVITGPLGEVLSNGRAHPFFTEPDVLSAASGTGGLFQAVAAFAMRIQGQCTPLSSA